MGHNSGIETEYGGYKQMTESFVESAKSVYPFLRLNDVESNNGNGRVTKLSEDVSTLKRELEQANEDKKQLMEMLRDPNE